MLGWDFGACCRSGDSPHQGARGRCSLLGATRTGHGIAAGILARLPLGCQSSLYVISTNKCRTDTTRPRDDTARWGVDDLPFRGQSSLFVDDTKR